VTGDVGPTKNLAQKPSLPKIPILSGDVIIENLLAQKCSHYCLKKKCFWAGHTIAVESLVYLGLTWLPESPDSSSRSTVRKLRLAWRNNFGTGTRMRIASLLIELSAKSKTRLSSAVQKTERFS